MRVAIITRSVDKMRAGPLGAAAMVTTFTSIGKARRRNFVHDEMFIDQVEDFTVEDFPT
jgi:hypothetical protein